MTVEEFVEGIAYALNIGASQTKSSKVGFSFDAEGLNRLRDLLPDDLTIVSKSELEEMINLYNIARKIQNARDSIYLVKMCGGGGWRVGRGITTMHSSEINKIVPTLDEAAAIIDEDADFPE